MRYDEILKELAEIRADQERVARHIKNAINSLDQALTTAAELEHMMSDAQPERRAA